MNTSTSKKTAYAIVAGLCFLLLSSYTLEPTESHLSTTSNPLDEYYKVQEFVSENVCEAMSARVTKEPGKATKYFSRCPSGYEPNITTNQDSVRTDRFVNGKIVFFKGCSPLYVCDFKVCVAKNFVMVRSAGKEYLTVNEWINRKNKTSKPIAKN